MRTGSPRVSRRTTIVEPVLLGTLRHELRNEKVVAQGLMMIANARFWAGKNLYNVDFGADALLRCRKTGLSPNAHLPLFLFLSEASPPKLFERENIRRYERCTGWVFAVFLGDW